MLALRRASLPLRSRELSIRVLSAAFPNSERLISYEENKAGILESPELASERCLYFKGFYRKAHFSGNLFLVRRGLSSQTGAENSGAEEDDLEDGFSELESEDSAKAGHESSTSDSDDELISEPLFSDEDDAAESAKNELEIEDVEADLSKKVSYKKRAVSELFKVIIGSQDRSIHSALDKWVEEGNEVNREEIALAMLDLRKARMFTRALQLSEWLESSKKIEFLESDYSSRVDLIAKVHGLPKAEKYIKQIPDSFRGEYVYRSLLAYSVLILNVTKAEEIFNTIKDLKVPVTSFTCDQMLLLYKKYDIKKLADVLLFMEKENVKPSIFTYRLLIDTKGRYGDISGMEQLVERMKAEGIAPDPLTKSIMVRHYKSAGLQEKAEGIIIEMENSNLNKNRHLCRNIIELYAYLGRADEVSRVWKVCESNPRVGESIAAIEAFGKLKKIEEAEAVFEKLLEVVPKPTAIHYNGLLKAYVSCKMLQKGKDLLKRMGDKNCHIGPRTWDLIVKLYVVAGEIEKADSVLHKASMQSKEKPLFSSYIAIMDQYAKRGDIHNAEKIYLRLKQAGYSPRLRQFQTLVRAYITAKAPFYGVRDRMKADNITPTKSLLGSLILVDAFRKTTAYELLD